MHRHRELLAHGPHRVVTRVVVRLVRLPHRRDEDAAPQSGRVRPADLGDRGVDVDHDRHDRHTGASLGALLAQLGQPTVVGAGAGEAAGRPGCRRWRRARRRRGPRRHPLTESASGKMISPTTPSASSSLSRAGRVPAAAQALLVLLVPGLGELLVQEAGAAPSRRREPARRRTASKRSRYSGSSHSRYSGPGRPACVSPR